MSFSYAYWRHDPYPLIVVTKVLPGQKVFGVNLHYITFPIIKNILRSHCGDPGFSYASIKGDQYIVGALRSYKWQGIRQVKVLDHNFLLTVMGMVRSFDPAEVEIIRRTVQEQIGRQVNPRAYEVTTPLSQNIQSQQQNQLFTQQPAFGQPQQPITSPAPAAQPTPTGTIPGQSATVPSIPGSPASQ